MNDYAQVRYQPTSKPARSLKHDLRINKPDYLRNDMWHNQLENHDSSTDYQALMKKCNALEELFKKRYKERVGRNPQVGIASAFNIGIITLSNSINEMLRNGEIKKDALDKTFLKAIDNQLNLIEKETGTRPELIHISIHYDEKTPHAHFLMSNFDNNGRSINYAMRTKKKLSRCQDQVGLDFNHLGFRRGEKKASTGAKHMNIRQMHEEELKQLKKEKGHVETRVEDLEKQVSYLKSMHIKHMKNIEKLEIKNKNLINEYQQLEEEVAELQSQKTALKSEIKELQAYKKEFKKEVMELKEELIFSIEKAKKIIKEEFDKVDEKIKLYRKAIRAETHEEYKTALQEVSQVKVTQDLEYLKNQLDEVQDDLNKVVKKARY